MGRPVIVGISDQKTATAPDILVTYALGSCVGICIYDTKSRLSGLAHILLPETFGEAGGKNVFKFADTAIEKLVATMESMGSSRMYLTAKIAGGANMFTVTPGQKSIGERNVATVKKELVRLRLRLVAEDTGADYGRTVEFDPESGLMTVKTIGKGNRVL